jgi:hypothetical protein
MPRPAGPANAPAGFLLARFVHSFGTRTHQRRRGQFLTGQILMIIDQERVRQLILRPSEGLNVEVKRWINPKDAVGTAKIVWACFALRNRNGGFLVFGFDNKTLLPNSINRPADVRAAFHLDEIQGLISRYASEPFEIGVEFEDREGVTYPVIVIPPGVTHPVAAKRDLQLNRDKLIAVGDVYFRTLKANGTPSTARARPEDWREIVEICFDNREADLGRFFRRQFSGRDVTALTAALNDLVLEPRPAPTLKDKAISLLNDGLNRFDQAVAARKMNDRERSFVELGSWEVALLVDPPILGRLPDEAFLRTIASSNPQYSGWPIWVNSQGFIDRSAAPIVKDKAWEALIISLQGWSNHVDFVRFDPKGAFYQWRNLQDDSQDRLQPGTVLDPIIVILRVAETIAVGLAFANALGSDNQNTRLGFGFRWKKLQGRELRPWANPMISISAVDVAHDHEVTTFVELSLDTPISAIAPYVDAATQELFVLFGGYRLPFPAVEDWVRRLIERRLS